MKNFEKIDIPPEGDKIELGSGKLSVPDNPIIPYIVGDGIGPDIRKASAIVLEAAVEEAYQGKRKIHLIKYLR